MAMRSEYKGSDEGNVEQKFSTTRHEKHYDQIREFVFLREGSSISDNRAPTFQSGSLHPDVIMVNLESPPQTISYALMEIDYLIPK